MNSTERVHAALTGVMPDRVPIVEMVVDPKVALALVPGAADTPDALDQLGLDSVNCGANFPRVWEDGDRFGDEWGVTYLAGPQVVSHPIAPAFTTREEFLRWEAPDPDAPQRLETLRDLVARFRGQRAILFHHRAAFMHTCYLLGIDRVLEMFYTDPSFIHEVLDRVVAVNERVIRNAVRAGAEVITLGDDYASNQGPLFSPAMFREFLLPRLQRVVDAIHEEGGLVIKHSDGQVWPLLEDIVNTGADGLNPLEPVAGMDLGEVKALYGDRICLVGNIDCGDLLSNGTSAQVQDAVREAIAAGAPGGRYMLSSSNSIHASVKPENFRAMIEAGRRYGVL